MHLVFRRRRYLRVTDEALFPTRENSLGSPLGRLKIMTLNAAKKIRVVHVRFIGMTIPASLHGPHELMHSIQVAIEAIDSCLTKMHLVAGSFSDQLPLRIVTQMTFGADGVVEFRVMHHGLWSLGEEEPDLSDPIHCRLAMAFMTIDQMMGRGGPLTIWSFHDMAGVAKLGVMLDVLMELERGNTDSHTDPDATHDDPPCPKPLAHNCSRLPLCPIREVCRECITTDGRHPYYCASHSTLLSQYGGVVSQRCPSRQMKSRQQRENMGPTDLYHGLHKEMALITRQQIPLR